MVFPIVTADDVTAAQSGDKAWAVEQATATVRAFCGWHVAPVVTEDLTVDTNEDLSVLLPTKRLVSVSAATLSGEDILDCIEWSAAGVLRLKGGCRWPKTYRGLVVSVSHGFPVEETPLVGIITGIVSRSLLAPAGVVSQNQTTGPFTLQQTFGGSGSAGGSGLMDFEKSALAPFRLSWGV